MPALVLLLSRFAAGIVPCADSIVAAIQCSYLRQWPGVALPIARGGRHCLPAKRQLPGARGGRPGSATIALCAAVGQLAAAPEWPAAACLSGAERVARPRRTAVVL